MAFTPEVGSIAATCTDRMVTIDYHDETGAWHAEAGVDYAGHCIGVLEGASYGRAVWTRLPNCIQVVIITTVCWAKTNHFYFTLTPLTQWQKRWSERWVRDGGEELAALRGEIAELKARIDQLEGRAGKRARLA
jgi:hypothetical protein